MHKKEKIFSAVSVFVLIALSATAAGPMPRKIVVFDESHFNGAYSDSVIEKHGGVKISDLDFVKAKVAYLSDKNAEALSREAGVLRVENDAIVTTQTKPAGGSATPTSQVLPWGINKIDAEQVWPSGNTADTVKVAVIDTGISSSNLDISSNIKGGVNFVKIRNKINPNQWNDDNGHGSHVAGIIAALDNSQGVVGVAPNADLYAVKVLNAQGSGFNSDVIAGIGWAVANGMDVINMSLGCACNTESLHNAVIAAYNAGVVVVAAAGNDPTKPVIFPAAYPEVIAVAATDVNNNIASFSTSGPEVDVAAPGVNIYSTYKGSGYVTMSGTSMASPHVAGAAALILNSLPGLSPAEVKTKLQSTATDFGATGFDNLFGWGLINAFAATQ